MKGLVIAAPASGQGKTTVTLGLLRALRDRGVQVASGKSGPDYIDPGFHRAATGRPCVTLDAWAAGADAVRGRAQMHGREGATDLLVVEAAMGAFDGAVSPTGPGRGSAADVAVALGVPMILVVDVSHMAQSAGAVVQGFAHWAREAGTGIAGVILNRVGSEKHLSMARRAVEAVCPVLGAVPRHDGLTVPSRHLGLVQAEERDGLEGLIAHAAQVIGETCDLKAIQQVAADVGDGTGLAIPPLGQRIAVAQDRAFGFAYWHMLEDWRAAGAEVLPFSPLGDEAPDATADAVFLPGGYPELHGGTLSAASTFLAGLRDAAGRGTLIHGECGGYMVLGEGLVDAEGVRHRMAGLLPLETSFAARRLHLGYRRLDCLAGPWKGSVRCHEFHYATTLRAEGEPLYLAQDAAGTDLPPMGLVAGRVMGSFAHVIERG